ncbi:MAG: hypothetical protein NTX44_03740 [Ignavibacteriales bacterium]|nr:hypothetical protein [Ignavibacteriales bacterium]
MAEPTSDLVCIRLYNENNQRIFAPILFRSRTPSQLEYGKKSENDKPTMSFPYASRGNLTKDKARFPFPIRNISGQVKTYGNDRKILNDRIYYKGINK